VAESATIVGEGCFLMANCHIGHDCQLGHNVIVANGALLAGHVTVGSGAFISGNVAVHQFVRIGELAMIGGLAKVVMDVPPYFMVAGTGVCVGINLVGLRRAGFSRETRNELSAAYQLLYRSRIPFREAVEQLSSTIASPAAATLADFLRDPSRRGIMSARAGIQIREDPGIAAGLK
jgi:UDP-N-acetylglucosamine acyltransferase